MTRKEKLNQAKRLADLWYKQQKSQLYIALKKSAGGLHDEKSDYAAKQIVAYKIILEKL
ncbi:TPA: hypothetical protein ACUZBJ_003093 [Enterococcus faecalis]